MSHDDFFLHYGFGFVQIDIFSLSYLLCDYRLLKKFQ